MSWAADEWKDGLPQKALSKITEIEAHLERLKKERDQKQFQVESLEQALQVQKRKGTNEKSGVSRLERENQTLVETCKQLELKNEKLASDLELKEAHVSGLEDKVAELCSTVPGKITEPACQHVQGSDLQSGVIRALEQEIAELRKQVEEKHDAANTSARSGSGDEGSSTKSLRHKSEAEELRKTMLEMQALRSLVSELEGRNKKLIQEGECARHNAEAARLHLEVKMKENEKDLKRDLAQALEAAKTAERVLQESRVKWQQEINAAHAEQSKMTGLMEKLETENSRLVREHEDITKRLAAAEDIIKNNDARVAEADRRKTALEAEKQSLASELEHKTREVETQSAELTKLKSDIGQREQTNDTLKGQLMDRTLESDKFKAEANATSQTLLLTENQLMELQKLQQKTDDHIKEMSLSLNQLQKEKETLEGSSKELVTQLQKLQEESLLVSATLQATQAQLGQVESNLTESQNKWNDLERTLRHELSQSVSSVADLSEQKMASENQLSLKDVEIVELRNRCQASEREVSSKDEELSQKSQDILELEKQLQTLQDQQEVLKNEHHQQEMLAKEKMAQLEMAVIEKTQELEMLVIQSSQDKTVLEATTEKLLEEKQTLQLEISSCRLECESSKALITSLNEEIRTLKDGLECRDTSLAEMEVVIQNKDKELHEKKEENVALSIGVRQRDQEVQLVKEKLVSMEKELEVSQKELQHVGEKCEGLESGTASFISQIEECRRQEKCREEVKEQLEKQVADLQIQFDLSQSECSTLSEQVKCEQEKVVFLEKNVDSLQTKCSELEGNARVWVADLESSSTICGQLEAQCLQLSENLHSQKAENSDLSGKLGSMEAELADCEKLHQQTEAELREQLQETLKCSNELKSLLEQKDNLLSELESEITRLKNGTADLERVCLSQKVDIEQKVALVGSLEKMCASLGDELQVVKLMVIEKEHQRCSQLENLSQMENKVRQLEEEKKALEMTTEQLDVLQKELLQNTQDLSQKILRVTELEYHVGDLSNRLSGAQKDAAESDAKHAQEMGTLKSKLDMLEMDVEDSDGQVKDLNEKISDSTALLEKATQERDRLKKTLQELSEEVGELTMSLESEKTCLVQVKQERDRLTEQNGNLKTELEQMTSVIHSLEEKHACLSGELKASQMKMEEQEHILCSHLEDFSRKENSMRQLEEEKNALERTTTEELALLQKELLKYTEELSQKTSRITELEDQVEDLNSRLSEAGKEALDLEAKYTHESGTLKSKLDMLEMDVEDSDGQVKDLNEKISDLTTLLEKATQERDRLQETLQELNEEVGELKMSCESEQACLVQVKLERDRMTEENSSLKSSLLEIQAELDKNNSLYEEKELLLEKIQKDNEELMKKLQDCEAERDLLIHRSNELDQALSVEKELVLAKTKETDVLSKNCSLLSNKLEIVTEQLSEQVLEVSSRTQSLQAVECKLRELESSSLMHEERVQKEVEELQLLVLQREESLTEVEKRREELESVIEDLKSKLSQAEQMMSDGALQHEQNVAIVQSQLEMVQMDVEDKNCGLQQLNEKIYHLEDLIEKMAEDKKEIYEAEIALRADVLKLESALEGERQNAAGVKLNENSLNERITSLDCALVDARQELEENEKLLQALQEQYESVNARGDRMEKQFKEEKVQMSAEIADLQLCLAAEKQTVQSTMSELEAATHRCTELSEELENVTGELSQLQTELTSQIQSEEMLNCRLNDQEEELTRLKEASHEDLKQLQTELESREQREMLNCRLRDQEEELTRLKTSDEDLKQLQKNFLESQMELNQRTSRINDLEEQVVDITGKFDDVQREKDEENLSHRQEVARLHSQLEMLQMDCEAKELRTKISNLESETARVVSEKVKIAEVVASLETELLQLKTTLDVEREKATQVKLSEDTLKDRIQFLEASLSAVKLEKQEKENRLQNVQSECETAKEMIVKHERVIKEYQLDQDNANTMIRNGHQALDEQKLLVEAKTLELNVAHKRYAAVLEELEEMRSEVAGKQNGIDVWAQEVVQLKKKINQLEKEKEIIRDEFSRDIEQLQEKLFQNKERLENESMRDLGIGKKELNVQMADTQCENGVLHFEEEPKLNGKLDMLEVDMKVQEDCGSDQDTTMSTLTDQPENLSNDKPDLKEAFQSTNCETELVHGNGTTEQRCLVITELTEGQKEHTEHLKSGLLKFREALLENRQGFTSLVQRVISQKHNSNMMCGLNTEIIEFERLILSVQQIVDFLMLDVGGQSSQDLHLLGEAAAAGPELTRSQQDKAEIENSHLNSFEATLKDNAKEHSEMQIEDGNSLNAEISEVKGIHLRLSNLQEAYCEAEGERTSDNLNQEKEPAILASTMEELRNEIEQKNKMIEELVNKETDLETVFSAVNDDNSKLQTTKASLECENSLLQESHAVLKEETVRLMSEIQSLLAAFAELENVLAEKTASVECGKQELVKLEQKLAEALDNCENLKLSLRQKTDQISLLETTITDLESQIEIINNERSIPAKCASREAETIPLQLSSMKEDLEARDTELEQLKAQFDEVNRSLVKSNSKLAELQVEKTTLSEQMENIEKLTKSYLQERDNTINILREELDSAAQENDALKADKGEWQTREDKYKQEINDLDVKLSDLNMEVVSTRESFESVSNQRFEAQGKLNNALQEQKNLEGRVKEMEVELEEAKRLVENVQILELKLEELKEEIIAKDEEIKSLKAQVNEMCRLGVGKSDSFEKQKEDLERCLSEVNERNRGLEEQLNEVTSVMNDMKEQLAQLQELMQTLNNSVDSKRKEIIQRVNEICEKNDEISQLKAVVEEKEKMNTEMSNQIRNIQKEAGSTLGTLQDALESLNFELQVAEEEKKALAGENEILKKGSQELHEKMKTLMNVSSAQEGCSGGESRTQVSHQDLSTLQDAIESLNFELKAVEEERDALVSENEILKKASIELHEKIQKLIQGGETSSDGDLSKQPSSLEKLVSDLTEHVHSLERKNNDMKKPLEDELKMTLDLSVQVQSLNEQLKEKITLIENMAVQVESLTADLSFSVKQLSEKEAELCESKEAEEGLNARVSELMNQITSLQLDLDCKNDQVHKLKDEHENILIKCQELESVNLQLQENLKQELQVSEGVKENLQTKEMAAAEFDQLIEDYNLAVIERGHLRDRVEALAHVESDKQKVEEELKLQLDKQSVLEQKVQELEKELVRRGNLDKMLDAAELEKDSLRETVETVELDNQLLGDKVKEMEKEVEGLMQEKDLWEEKVTRLEFDNCGWEEKVKEMDKVVDELVNEKASLESKVMKLESFNCQYEDRLKELEQKVDDLTIEKVSLQTEIKKLECDNSQLEDRLKELEQKVDDLTTEKVSLQTEIKKLECDNSQLEDRLKELEQKVDDLTTEKVALQTEIKKLECDNCQLEDRLKELDQIIEDSVLEKVSLQDNVKELQSSNCKLEDKLKEFVQVTENTVLEKVSLQDKVKELQSSNCQLEDKLKEVGQVIEDCVLEKVALQDEVKNLKVSNCQLEDKLKELDQTTENVMLEKAEEASLHDEVKKLQSSNCQLEDKLKELGQMIENAALEKISLQDEVKKLQSSNCEAEDKLKEFDQIIENAAIEKVTLQGEVKKLQSNNCQLEDKMNEFDQIIENAAIEKVTLQEKIKNLECNNCQLEDKLKELDQIIENAAIEKVSLQDQVQALESSNCQLEDKLKELDQIIENAAIEKVSLQDQVQALESSNCHLEDKLKKLSQKMEDIPLEKASLQDRLQKLESAKDQLENQLKEMEVAASEYVQLKERFEVQEKTLAEKLQELSQSVAEKAYLESQLKNLQNERSQTSNTEGSGSPVPINEQHKELLRKWESRCSELSAQLAMDRKKIQRLTQQVETLKSSKEVDIVEDNKFQALKEELEEVKQERDVSQEKFVKMSEAAERHFNKSKDLQRLNEKLNSRNKLLNALLKGDKPRMIVPVTGGSLMFGAQNQHSEPGTGRSTETPRTAQGNSGGLLFGSDSEHGLPSCGSKQMESGVQLSESVAGNTAVSSQADTGKAQSVLEENKVSGDTKEKLISDANTVKAHSILEEDNKMSSHTKEKLISDTDSVQAPCTPQINSKVSWNTKENPKLSGDRQNAAEANDHADPCTGSYSTRSSTRLKLRSPKAQSVQKSRISTPKSAIPPQLVQSAQKQKVEFISDVVPSLSKMQTQTPKDSELSLSKLKTPSSKVAESPLKLKKQTFGNVSVFKTVNMPSKVMELSTSTSKVMEPSTCTSKVLESSTCTSKIWESSTCTSKVWEPSTCTSKVSHSFTSTSTTSSHANGLGQEPNVKQTQPCDVTDQLKPIPSPRVSRRMSLKKRRSTEQSSEVAGGKKSKLSLQEPVPETRSITGGKTSAQTSRLPQPAPTRTGQTTGLPRPMRTRSRQDTLTSQSQKALSTITNSPKKTLSQESKLTRASRATARNVTSARTQAAEEGASECKIN